MKPIFLRRHARAIRICAVPFAALFAVGASAANISWTGATDAVWSTGGNWVGGVAPAPADTAVFDAGSLANLTTSLGTNFSVLGLKVTSPAGAVTIAGGNTLTLAGGGIDMSAASQDLTVSALVALAANQSWDVAAGRTLTASGAVSGAVNLTKIGAGKLVLSGTNTFTGGVIVSAGTLRAQGNANALGTGVATLSISGGRLELANDNALGFNRNTTISGNATIVSDRVNAGAGVTHTLGTLSIGGNTLSTAMGANVNSGTAGVTFGATSLTGAAVFNVGFGTQLTLGAVADNGNTATLRGGGNFTQSGAWGNGAGGLTLETDYTGVATLNQANTFTGTVTVKNGVLVANTNAGALGLGLLDLRGGVLDFNNASDLAFNIATILNGNGLIVSEKNAAGAGGSYTLGALNVNGAYTLTIRAGNVNSGTAGLVFGATTFNGDATVDTWNPTIINSSNAGPGSVQVTFGPVTGNGFSLTKVGSGTLLSTQSSGTPFGNGNVVLHGGRLSIAPSSAGANAVNGVNAAAGSTFTYRAGTLQLTSNGTSLAYTIGNAGAAPDSVLARVASTRGTLSIGVTSLANLQTSEQFIVNGQTTASNKNGAANGAGIYDASVVAQDGTGGSFVVADTAANGGFKQAVYTTAVAASAIPANTISDVTSSIAINDTSNPYALRVGAFTLTNSGTTTVNGGAASSTNSGLGGVILNPTATVSSITGGTLAFGSSEGVVYVGSGASNGSIASIITGTGGLTKFGPGTLTLTSANNSYSGGTTINGGTLWITNEAQLGTAASININGGGTLLLGDAANNPSLAAARNIVLGPGIQNIVKWTRRSATINGVISGSGGLNFGDNTAWGGDGGGGGRFTLNAANTYTGDTILTYAGIKDPGIVVGNTLALQFTTVDYNTTDIPNGINAGSMIIWGVANPIVGGFKGNRDWNMSYQSNPATMNIGNNNQDTIYSGVLSSTNTSTKLVKIGTGTLTLKGANTYAGGTEIQNGTLVLSGANTGAGNTLISGGTLRLANNLALQNSAYDTASTGTLSFATGIDTPTFGGLIGSGNLTLPANVTGLTLNPPALKTYSGLLNGATPSMTVTKIGANVQVFTGANTYIGSTILTGAGAMQIGVDPVGTVGSITSSALGVGTLIFNGGTLASNSTTARTILNPVAFTGNATLGDVTNTGKLTFSANVDLGGAVRTITVNSTAQFDGNFGGNGGGITKAGTGLLILNGAANSNSGATTISTGAIQFTGAGSISGTGRNVTVTSPGAVVFGPSFDTHAGADIAAALLNRIVATSTGAIAADNYAGTNFNFNSAGLTAASLGAVGNVTYTGTLTPNGTAYRIGGGGGTITMANTNTITGVGNTLTVNGSAILGAANDFNGTTTINSGAALTLGTGITGQNGSIGSASVVDNGTLVFNNADTQIFGAVISGTGGLTKNGVGNLILNALETYAGTTTLNAGTLTLNGGNNTLAANKAMVVNGGTLDLGSNSQYVSALSGTGGVITGNGGTLTSNTTSASTYAGSLQGSLNFARVGANTNILTLTGDSTTTGAFSVIGGDQPQSQGPVFGGVTLKDGGRLSGITALKISNGSLFIDNSGTANDNTRINDSATVTLDGGRIIYTGRASTASTEAFGAITASTGMSSISATSGGSGSAQLTLASLTRNSGAMLRLEGTSLGQSGNSSRIIVTGGLSGNLALINGVVPGVFVGSGGGPVDLAGYNANGFGAIGTAGFPAYVALAGAGPTSNVSGGGTVTAGGQTINGMTNGSIAFVNNDDLLTLTSGMIVRGSEASSIGTTAIRGRMTSGTSELFIVKTNEGSGGGQAANLNCVFTDNGATLVKLILNNFNRTNLLNQTFNFTSNNTHTGGTVVSGGNELFLQASTAGWTTIPAANDPTQGLIINNSTVTMQTNAQQIAATNVVTLNGSSKLNLFGANTLASLVFNSNGGINAGGSVPTVTGGTTLTIVGAITSNPTEPTVTPTISVPTLDLNAQVAASISVSALPQGNVINSNGTLTALNGLLISSVVQNGGITKSGTGVLNLTGANTFTGDLVIENGVVNISTFNEKTAAGPLGQSVNTIRLGKSGGQTGMIEYTGTSVTSTRPFTMATGGTGGFQVDVGTPTTTLTLQGLIDGGGGLVKAGLGTLKLNGAVSNTYGGLTTVSAGELNLSRTAAANLIPGDILVASGATLSESSNPNQIADTSALTLAGSYLLNSQNETIGSLTINGGSVTTGSGVLTLGNAGNQLTMTGGTFLLGTAGTAGKLNLNGNVVVNSSSTIAAINTQSSTPSTVDLNGGIRTFDVAAGTGAAAGSEMTIAAPLTSPSPVGGGIIKAGSGALLLSGAGTYSGPTTVNAGTLAYGANDVIGAGTVTVNGATAILALGTNHNDSVGTVTLDGGGSITGSGTSTLTSTGSFEMKSGSVSAALSGGGIPLNKTTSSTVTLTGANTYSGATNVNAGTLALMGSGSLGNTAITVAGGATFAVKPGSTISAGTTGAGTAGASLTLNAGSAFTMADNGIGTFNLQQNDSFASAGLVASVASGTAPTLTFDLGNGTIDLLNVTKAANTSLAVKGQVNFTTLTGLSSLTLGSYPFINALGGGLGASAFTLSNPLIVVGSSAYSLSLADSSPTQEVLTITAYSGGAAIQKFDRTAPASLINVRPGATLSMSGTLANIGNGNLNVSLASTGALSVTGLNSDINPVTGTPANITGTINAGSTAGSLGWQVTNTDNGAANPTASISGTVNVYDIANATYTGGTLVLGNVHKLATSSQAVAFGNRAVTDSNYQDLLNVSATTNNAKVTATGFTGLAASTGGSTTGNLTFSANTSAVGSLASTVTLALTSNANGLAGLSNGTANVVASPSPITITGQVYSGLMVWNGASGGNWNTDANWNDSQDAIIHAAPGLDAAFTNVDTATFGNTAGNVSINMGGAAPSLNAITFNSTGSYTITGASAITMAGTTPTITVTGTHTISAPVTLASSLGITTGTAGDTLTIGGIISGTGFGLTKSGAGALVLSGANTYSGATTLNAGTLSLGSSTALGSGTLVITGGTLDSATANLINTANNAQNWNGNFAFAGTNSLNLGSGIVTMNATRTVTVSDKTLTIGGIISGNGLGLTKSGAGKLVLGGTNTFTGATTLSAGTLSVGADANLGNANALVFNGGTLQVTGTALTSYAAGVIGSHAVTLTPNATVGFDIANVGNTFSVTQSLNQGAGGLTKAGAGTLVLVGTNGYTGQTTVNGGVLLVSGSITGSTTVVNSGGTLGGTGTAGSVTVSGGVIAPGDPSAPGGIGDMTVNGNVSFSGSSALNIQFDYDLPGKDLLNLTGTGILTISSGAVLNLSVSVSDAVTIAAPYIGTPLTIIDYADGGWTSTGPGNNMFAGMNDDQTFIAPSGFTYRISYDGTGGVSEVTLTLEAIPEPGVAVSLLGGLGLLLGVRRRRA